MVRTPELIAAVGRTLARYRMVASGDRVVVAVSGGPDSTALLHALWRLRGDLRLSLHVAHLDHRLRGEASVADARHVADMAASLGLPCTMDAVDVAALSRRDKLSLEDAGRRARYRFLRRVRDEVGAARVALGHTRDDQAETVLMRLLRGAGPGGLGGIPPVRGGWVIRPLIEVGREQVEAYCREEGLHPRQDPTNLEAVPLRNRIRLELLPLLERQFNPALRHSLARLAEMMREEDAWLAALAADAFGDLAVTTPGQVALPLGSLQEAPLALRRRLVRLAWQYLAWQRLAGGVGEEPEEDAPLTLDFHHVERVLGLVEGRPGAWVPLPRGILARRTARALELARGVPDRVAPYTYDLPVPGRVRVPEAGLWIEAEVMPVPAGSGGAELWGDGRVHTACDADLVPGLGTGHLAVRNRRPGDRFWPLGLGGSTRLKGFLNGARVPLVERDRLPLILSEGQVLWVVGHRPDDRFRVTPETRRLLVLRAIHGEDWPPA